MIEYKGKELIIMACSQCNINCKHCYISYKGNRSASNLLELVKKLSHNYIININGAEILTNIDYLKSYDYIGQKFLMTNGKAIYDNPYIVNQLKYNGINSISMSYHFDIQNDISIMNYDMLNKVIEILKQYDMNFRLLTTINSKNYMSIQSMCDNAFKLGARGIKFTNYLFQGNAKHMNKNNILSFEQKEIFFKQIIDVRKQYDKDILLIERCGTFGKNYLSNNDHFCCDCITDSIVLTPDNYLYPCVFLAKPGYEIGKYYDGKLLLYDDVIKPSYNECLVDNICNKEKKC